MLTRALLSCALLSSLAYTHATTILRGSVLDASAATWQGRTLPAPSNVSFSWAGVQATFNVSGASTILLLASSRVPAGSTSFRTLIDGALALNWTLSSTQDPVNITIASNLDGAQHQVTIWSITDPIIDTWDKLPPWSQSFHSFFSDGVLQGCGKGSGALLGCGKGNGGRRLAIVGDSITAGNQIDPATCAADHLGTYGARLCQRYNADCQTLAISGKGLFKNCCDDDVTMSTLRQRTIVGYPDLLWSDEDFVPDAVVLALGTNDSGYVQQHGLAANFSAYYAQFLMNLTVIHKNPALPIFAACGPITHIYCPWIQSAIALSGLKTVQFVNFSTPVDRCGHPPYASHELVSALVAWGCWRVATAATALTALPTPHTPSFRADV